MSRIVPACWLVVLCGCDAGASLVPQSHDAATDVSAPQDDASSSDAASIDEGDAVPADGAVDGSAESGIVPDNYCSGPDGSPCMRAGLTAICLNNACACYEIIDDALCNAAYSDGGARYLCSYGMRCVQGECHESGSDCPTFGQVCSVDHHCAPCTQDINCAWDPAYGTQATCDTATGLCVQPPCPSGMTRCGPNCVDLTSDVVHCGACDHSCLLYSYTVTEAVCANAQCGYTSCANGYTDCDQDPTNGCEAHTAVDSSHCGPSCSACPAGQFCGAGQCAPACGAQGEPCCAGSCQANLNCTIQGVCLCGDYGFPCCGGTLCANGLPCTDWGGSSRCGNLPDGGG